MNPLHIFVIALVVALLITTALIVRAVQLSWPTRRDDFGAEPDGELR